MEIWEKIKGILKDFPRKHPYLPLGLAITALAASICMPILRRFLEGMI